MKHKFGKTILLACLWMGLSSASFSMEKSFYVLHQSNVKTNADISSHAKSINILIAQSFRINSKGAVNGELNPDYVKLSNNSAIKLMAMITNSYFDAAIAHHFLADSNAQNKALNTILASCIKNHIYGVQFDFEMIALADRSGLTRFYQKAADLFHKHGFVVSFAIAPVVVEKNFPSSYYERLYKVWQGAYDLNTLGRLADFVTVMTYDQHGEGTTPGPIASIQWDELVIKHLLKFIPAHKISLGIPTYSGLWYMAKNSSTKKITTHYSTLDFDTVKYIINKFDPELQWSNTAKVNYTFFEYNLLNKFIFLENARSMKPKIAMAQKYNLRGISVFRLGIEDPKVWDEL